MTNVFFTENAGQNYKLTAKIISKGFMTNVFFIENAGQNYKLIAKIILKGFSITFWQYGVSTFWH